MNNEQNKLRKYIRRALQESISNFLDKEEETATKQLHDTSRPHELGDPLATKLNQMANELGSDEKNAPTVAVVAGTVKGGNGPEAGQRQATFRNKTKLA